MSFALHILRSNLWLLVLCSAVHANWAIQREAILLHLAVF